MGKQIRLTNIIIVASLLLALIYVVAKTLGL